MCGLEAHTFLGSAEGLPKHQHRVIASFLDEFLADGLNMLVVADLGIVVDDALHIGAGSHGYALSTCGCAMHSNE